MAADLAVHVDGRLGRGERARTAVVDALLDLIEEGDLPRVGAREGEEPPPALGRMTAARRGGRRATASRGDALTGGPSYRGSAAGVCLEAEAPALCRVPRGLHMAKFFFTAPLLAVYLSPSS